MAAPHSTPTGTGSGSGPNVEEAFVADHQRFWAGFVKFTTYSVAGIVVLLVVLALTIV